MTRQSDSTSPAIVLFTQDLRVHDNPVLDAALADGPDVLPLFVLDDAITGTPFAAPNRMAFLADCLADLDASLRSRGGRLVVRKGSTAHEVKRLMAETGAARIHIAAGVTRHAAHREETLRAAFGDRLHVHGRSLTVLDPGAVTPSSRDHYAVFTPYLRAWSAVPGRKVLSAPARLDVPESASGTALPSYRAASPALPKGGESEGRRVWRRWVDGGGLAGYDEAHDALGADGTSRISPYLHFGCLSATEIAAQAAAEESPGAEAFVRQLAWRDFHHQVLAARPDCADTDYRKRGDTWVRDKAEAKAWREGRTGYPLVDAGMRQLAHEGWMHNRARLLTASFLVKTLRHDWREGAAHFLSLLVDGDIANNQMNWQWMAGTGNDTRPNRVLNPLAQARRLDPDGTYVRQWVPELSGLSDRAVREPWKVSQADRNGYPEPLVEPEDLTARYREAHG
ncbi:MAG: deoxyribodipyrimidine photo-lyase [Streptomycetaceae bacterium]|nr:deoxyribodipyrimidine photo-lyase [Streptomycetaceae bacterium]